METILVTGAGGYVGSVLVPALLREGYSVVALDTFWFGDHLQDHGCLIKIQGDVRSISKNEIPKFNSVIHLASIANDPSVDLDPILSWEIGTLGTLNILNIANDNRVETFILASSGSVYGIKDEENVTEDLDLVPISVYNKVKMIKEKIVEAFALKFRVVIFRPATICGYSPRMRLDLAVNALAFDALSKGTITVFGGDQMRPQLHIDDMIRAYIFALKNKNFSGVYNIGFENDSILKIAKKVQKFIDSEIIIAPSTDPRSYRLNSNRIQKTGFTPIKNSEDAIRELQKMYNEDKLNATESNYNVNWMKNLMLNGES